MPGGRCLVCVFSANNALSRRVRLAIQAQLLADRDNGIADLFHGTLQLAFRHSKMLKPITNFCFNLHGDVAAVALALAGKNIAHQITRSQFEVNPRRVSSVMHKHGEQQNNRKRNSDEPKQNSFSGRHDNLAAGDFSAARLAQQQDQDDQGNRNAD
jgi:hypothetical protein